jgi:hypothetical protein
VKVQQYQKELRCVLTTPEVAERADRAAHMVAELFQIEEELASHNKRVKARIAEKKGEHSSLSEEVRTKATYRMVECHDIHNYTKQKVTSVRQDTGEVIDERKMTLDELQLKLRYDGDGSALKNPDQVAKDARKKLDAEASENGKKITVVKKLHDKKDGKKLEGVTEDDGIIDDTAAALDRRAKLQAEVDADDGPIEPDPALADQPEGFVPVGYEEAEE